MNAALLWLTGFAGGAVLTLAVLSPIPAARCPDQATQQIIQADGTVWCSYLGGHIKAKTTWRQP